MLIYDVGIRENRFYYSWCGKYIFHKKLCFYLNLQTVLFNVYTECSVKDGPYVD